MKKQLLRLKAYRNKLFTAQYNAVNNNLTPHSPNHWVIAPKGGEPIPTQGNQSQILTIGWGI